MNPMPKGGLIGKTIKIFDDLSKLQIPILASSACYFLALAVFPALVLLISLIRYTPLEITTIFAVLEGIVPDALMPYAEKLIMSTYNNASGALVSVSAITALWSASRGIHGLLSGLNVIYDVVEDRNFFLTRIISMGYTFAFIIVLLLTLVLHVFGTTIMDMLPTGDHPLFDFLADVVDLRFFLLLGLQTALFTAIYTVFPNRPCRPADSVPGALLASLGWLVFSNLFSLYIDYFGDHTHLYGQVYTMALSMLWLYCCLCIVYFGGAVNRFLAGSSDTSFT